jgi:Holliday junction resolvase RusA-like endonuclease
MVLPSEKYKDWHIEATWQLRAMKKDLPKKPLGIGDVKQVTFTMFAPDSRKADLSNKWESVQDFLVDVGVLEDDCWFILGDIRLVFGGIDIKNPRAVIEII